MELILLVLVVAVLGAVVLGASRQNKNRELARREDEIAPVRKLAFEDITAFGEDLQQLDAEMSGHDLDAGANSDYQRALDAYESAKVAGDSINRPEDIRHITEIVEDGRYAIACVRARVEGEPLPTRRPPCFFDPPSRALGRRRSLRPTGRCRAGRALLRARCPIGSASVPS